MTSLRLRALWPWLALALAVGLAATLTSSRAERARLVDELAGLSTRATELATRLAATASGAERLVLPAEDVWAPLNGQSPDQRLQVFALASLDAAGQTLLRYEQVDPPRATTTPAVALSLEFEGSLAGLAEVLRLIEGARPVLAVERLSVRARSEHEQVEGQTLVTSQLLVWGLAADAPL